MVNVVLCNNNDLTMLFYCVSSLILLFVFSYAGNVLKHLVIVMYIYEIIAQDLQFSHTRY